MLFYTNTGVSVGIHSYQHSHSGKVLSSYQLLKLSGTDGLLVNLVYILDEGELTIVVAVVVVVEFNFI